MEYWFAPDTDKDCTVWSASTHESVTPTDETVREHFGLSEEEQQNLFGTLGCGQAETVEEAADYVEAFVIRKWGLRPRSFARKPTPLKVVSAIAHTMLWIPTLDRRFSDSLDFHDVAVWSVKRALLSAFEAGKRQRQHKYSRLPKQR